MSQPYIHTPDIENQTPKKEMDIELLKKYFIFFFLILPFFVLSFLILKTNLKIYSLGKEIKKLEYESFKLEDEKIKLIIEKENLTNPEEIENISKDFGFAQIEEKKVVLIYEP